MKVRNDRRVTVEHDGHYFPPRQTSEHEKLESLPDVRGLTEGSAEEYHNLGCTICGAGPYASEAGLKQHIRAKHPEEG